MVWGGKLVVWGVSTDPHFAYLFIFCIDLLTSARSGHSG